jgi:hypothetical protein
MSKVREIIEDADNHYGFIPTGGGRETLVYDDDAVSFLRTFDPEHVALMENVVEVAHGTDTPQLDVTLNRLHRYRREHGLI